MSENKDTKLTAEKSEKKLSVPSAEKFDPRYNENLEHPELMKRFDFWGIGEFITFLKNPTRIFFLNLLAGLGRGVGFAIGFTVLTALVIFLLKRAVSVPVIGSYISKLLEFIEIQRQNIR